MDGDAPVVARMYELLKWLIGRVDNLPQTTGSASHRVTWWSVRAQC